MFKFFKKFSTMTIFFTVFTLFVIVSTSVLIMTTWHEVKRKAALELRYSNKMVSSTFAAQLQQYEILIRLLGKELLEMDLQHHPDEARPLITKLLLAEKSLVGFKIANTNGEVLFRSLPPVSTQRENLLKNPETRDSFKKALRRKTLTLGRVSYKKIVHTWIIPIRVPIYDQNGKITFIISAGVNLAYKYFPWKLDMLNTSISNVLLGYDNYFLYVSSLSANEMEKFYRHPLPPSTLKQIDLSKIIASQGLLFTIRDRYNRKQLICSSHNAHYQFISATQIPYSKLIREAYEQLFYFILGIVLFYIMAFLAYIIMNKREKEHDKKLLWIANHDSLTKLPNKYFIQQKAAEWNQKHSTYSVLFMDLNDFKYINDNYGHPFGDNMLIIIARRLSRIIRPHEIVARQGGDEFIMLTTHPLGDITHLAKRILNTISEPLVIDNITLYPKITIGLARYPRDSDNIDSLLSQAGMALHEAKKEKTNFLQYSKKLDNNSKHRLEIGMELRGAVQAGEFYLLFQPQMDAKTLRISGVEALVRWKNPKLGLVTPDQFIQIAEETGEIGSIGRFVLKEACLACQKIHTLTHTTFTLSINASVIELLTEGYVESVLHIVRETGFPKEQLLIEVTESLLIHDVEQAKRILLQLRNEGIGISLDDFGTGYSSLSILKNLPITELKIDQSFTFDLLKDDSSLQITRSIIALANIFGLKTVAEGVEEKEHVHALQEAGCAILQGYYFAKPLLQEDLIEFITQSNAEK